MLLNLPDLHTLILLAAFLTASTVAPAAFARRMGIPYSL